MSSTLLTSADIPELQPTVEFARWPMARRDIHSSPRTGAAAEAWQVACRTAVAQTVGFLDSPRVDPAPELIEEVDRGDFIRRKIVITTAPHAHAGVPPDPETREASAAGGDRVSRARLRCEGHRGPVGGRAGAEYAGRVS